MKNTQKISLCLFLFFLLTMFTDSTTNQRKIKRTKKSELKIQKLTKSQLKKSERKLKSETVKSKNEKSKKMNLTRTKTIKTFSSKAKIKTKALSKSHLQASPLTCSSLSTLTRQAFLRSSRIAAKGSHVWICFNEKSGTTTTTKFYKNHSYITTVRGTAPVGCLNMAVTSRGELYVIDAKRKLHLLTWNSTWQSTTWIEVSDGTNVADVTVDYADNVSFIDMNGALYQVVGAKRTDRLYSGLVFSANGKIDASNSNIYFVDDKKALWLVSSSTGLKTSMGSFLARDVCVASNGGVYVAGYDGVYAASNGVNFCKASRELIRTLACGDSVWLLGIDKLPYTIPRR